MPANLAKVTITKGGGVVHLDGQRVPAVRSVAARVEGGLVVLTVEIEVAEVEMVQHRPGSEGVDDAAPE